MPYNFCRKAFFIHVRKCLVILPMDVIIEYDDKSPLDEQVIIEKCKTALTHTTVNIDNEVVRPVNIRLVNVANAKYPYVFFESETGVRYLAPRQSVILQCDPYLATNVPSDVKNFLNGCRNDTLKIIEKEMKDEADFVSENESKDGVEN